MLCSHQTQNRFAKLKQNKTKQNRQKQAENHIKASYSTAHEKQNKHLSVACGTYFYPLLIPLPILLLAQRSLCWGGNLRGSLHLTRGKGSLGTSDLSYEPISQSEKCLILIKAIHVKPLCEHNIRETFILASSGNWRMVTKTFFSVCDRHNVHRSSRNEFEKDYYWRSLCAYFCPSWDETADWQLCWLVS